MTGSLMQGLEQSCFRDKRYIKENYCVNFSQFSDSIAGELRNGLWHQGLLYVKFKQFILIAEERFIYPVQIASARKCTKLFELKFVQVEKPVVSIQSNNDSVDVFDCNWNNQFFSTSYYLRRCFGYNHKLWSITRSEKW